MSYTAHEWQNGETITADKLNNLEEGIQEAVQSSGIACVRLSASGFSSGSKTFCYIVYAYKNNNTWIVESDDNNEWKNIYGWATPNRNLIVIPLPNDNNIGVFLLDLINDDKIITGDISTTPETLYFSYGSTVNGTAYQITGNGSFTFIAT